MLFCDGIQATGWKMNLAPHGVKANGPSRRRWWHNLGHGFAVARNDNLFTVFNGPNQLRELGLSLGDIDIDSPNIAMLNDHLQGSRAY